MRGYAIDTARHFFGKAVGAIPLVLETESMMCYEIMDSLSYAKSRIGLGRAHLI